MIDQRTELAADALKERVRDHWQRETCGTRYGEAADRLTWFRDIARARQTLEPYIASFARFEEAAGKRILEIGVGAGSDFTEWCRYAQHATGIDLTEAAITLTTERLALEGVPDNRFTLRIADAEALPFADASFNIVYAWGVLHHTPGTRQAYREILRVLKPGGVARTMVYHVPSWTGLMLYLMHGLAKGPLLGLRKAIFERLESPGTKAYTTSEGFDLARNRRLREHPSRNQTGAGRPVGDQTEREISGRGGAHHLEAVPARVGSLAGRPLRSLLADRRPQAASPSWITPSATTSAMTTWSLHD